MQVWLDGLFGGKAVPDYKAPEDDPRWTTFTPMNQQGRRYTGTVHGRRVTVADRFLREGHCAQCGGPIPLSKRVVRFPKDFCSQDCADADSVRRAMS